MDGNGIVIYLFLFIAPLVAGQHLGIFLAVTPYYKNKLKGLYHTAMQDAETEAE